MRMSSPRLCTTSSGVCSSPAWPALQKELDELPVFVFANADGEALQQIDEAGAPIVVAFADLFRAEAELANANRLYPDLSLRLLPIGLGDAFARTQVGSAKLIPSQNELAAAGLDSDSGMLPLFGCTKMMRPRASDPSKQAMPLFMASSDARAALEHALSSFAVPEGMTAEAVGLDILCIPLAKAVDLICSGKESRFEIFAPSSSTEWLKKLNQRAKEDGEEQGGGVGSDDAPGGGAGNSEDDAGRQQMFEELIDGRQALWAGKNEKAGQTPRGDSADT